jgi:hypothetical protein
MNYNDSALILFSGQRDSIDVLLNYAQKYDERSISLLYIKNVGFRTSYKVPLPMAREMGSVCPNILSLYVVDGGEIQISLLKYFAQEVNDVSSIQMLCLVCQFSLNYIYANMAIKLNAKSIVSNEEVLGESLKGILNLPYENLPVEKESYLRYALKNQYSNKCPIMKNKCPISYFHHYKFNSIAFDHILIKERLISFAGPLSLKYKKYKLR